MVRCLDDYAQDTLICTLTGPVLCVQFEDGTAPSDLVHGNGQKTIGLHHKKR